MEIWKDVVGYDGIYQVSDLGNVKSLERKVNNRGSIVVRKERMLSPSINRDGYLSVSFCVDYVMKTRSIHQLVAEAFLNHIPNGRTLVVNHKNFIRTDNRLDNLEIVTFRENTNRKHLKSSSQYTGVTWFSNRNKWMAQIRINNKLKYLGLFTDEIEASNAYQKELTLLKLK